MTSLYLGLLALGVVLGALLFSPLLKSKMHFKYGAIGTLCFALLSVGAYSLLGSPQYILWQEAQAERASAAKEKAEALNKKLAEDSENPALHIEMAEAKTDMGQMDEAIAHLKKAVLLSGGHPDVILMLAKAEILKNSGRVNDSAREALRIVLLQNPEALEAQFLLALDAEQNNRLEDAKNLYTLLSKQKKLPEAMHNEVQARLKALGSMR